MAEQSEFTIRQLLDLAERFDVPEVQRELVASARWCAGIIDSLFQEIPFGAPLLYEVDARSARPASRYQSTSHADWWIINGQQRLTAVLAAFGRRPPWIPQRRWLMLGGPDREVAVRFTLTGQFSFHPYKPGTPLQIRLADLLQAAETSTVQRLIVRTGVYDPNRYVERFAALAQRLLAMRVRVDWLRGDMDKAVTAFIRHNQASASKRLTPEEYRLVALSMTCPGLQRDIIDPAVHTVAQAGFPTAIGRPRIVTVMEHLLPPGATRVANRRRIDPARIADAAARAAQGCAATADFLHACGITSDELLCSPSAVEVLGVLFARFCDEAACDDFAWRWLVHIAARGTYHTLGSRHRADARAVAGAANYRDAVGALALQVPAGPIPPWDESTLQLGGRARATWGQPGTLFALASHAGVAGKVTDLGDPHVTMSDPRMRLRPLWAAEPGRRRTVAWLAWMTPDTAAVVEGARGWGRDAYDTLDCPDAALAAQCLARPVPALDVDAEIVRRSAAILEMVNTFLRETEPLRRDAREAVPAQLAVA